MACCVAQPPVVDRKNGVREDIGVAVALRVVEIDEQLLVVLVIVLVELGACLLYTSRCV